MKWHAGKPIRLTDDHQPFLQVLLSTTFGSKKRDVIRQSFRFILTALMLGLLGACSLLPCSQHRKNPETRVPEGTPSLRASSPWASLWPPWKILQRKKTTPPPKAAPLIDVGTIRSVSNDGSYVIVELFPGTFVRTGDPLIVTSKDHPVSKLSVAEVQAPCFAAEITEGSVCPGDVVKR